jgi:DHA1 family tetracycline resistance protein-like MFS transporter
MGLATIISPPLMTMSFSYFTSDKASGFYCPGMPYIIAAFLTFISLLLLIKKLNIKRKKQLTVRF